VRADMSIRKLRPSLHPHSVIILSLSYKVPPLPSSPLLRSPPLSLATVARAPAAPATRRALHSADHCIIMKWMAGNLEEEEGERVDTPPLSRFACGRAIVYGHIFRRGGCARQRDEQRRVVHAGVVVEGGQNVFISRSGARLLSSDALSLAAGQAISLIGSDTLKARRRRR